MKLLTTLILFTLWPSAGVSQPQAEESRNFGEYRFEIGYEPSGGRNYKILKDGQELHQARPGQLKLLSVSNGKQIDPTEPTVTDITGDGTPELIVEEFPMNRSCCWSYSIFSLGRTFKQMARLEGFRSPITFEDVNRDKVYEVVTYDWSYMDWYASPRVVLSYDEKAGEYRFAANLMKADAPSQTTLASRLREVQDAQRPALFPVPPEVHRYMLDLIYSGNSQAAFNFLDLAWPKEQEGKEAFVSEFSEKLKASPYWDEIRAMSPALTDR
jgi:hypothetical protein